MKTKTFLLALTAMAAAALTPTSAQAGLLVTYNGGTSLGLFSDTGSLIRTYTTSLSGGEAVAADASGNVYVCNGGLIEMYDIATGNFLRNIATTAYNDVRALAFDPTKQGQIVTIDNY